MDELNDIDSIEKKRKEIIIQSEKKKSIKSINDRYAHFEIDPITNKDPSEELKLIKERIKNENEKIKEINSKLEQLCAINNSKSTNKKNTKKNIYNRNQNSDLLYPNILVSSSQQITKKNYLLNCDPSPINLIHQKMDNLRKIKIGKIDNNDDKKVNINVNEINKSNSNNNSKLSDKRNKSNLRIDEKNALRLLSLEEEVKKEREEKKKEYEYKIKIFREKELEREKLRKKMIQKINNISLSQINKYTPKKNYITSEEREEMRKMEEESLIKLEIEKRKLKYIPISLEEINKFSKEVQKNEKIFKSELIKKTKQMEVLWKERKNLLPKYHSKFMNLNIELDNEAKEEINIKKEKLKNKEKERANFGKDVIKNHQPKILNDILKTEREQRIKNLKGFNRFDNIKELGNKLKEKSVKIVKSQPKNFDKGRIFIREETVAEQQVKKLTGKPVDYLLLCRNKKSNLEIEKLNENNSAKKIREWKEMLDCGGKDVVNNVERIKMQVAVMDDKASNINIRIKQESNNFKKDELSKEASNLYINSIHAKLQILNKMLDTQ